MKHLKSALLCILCFLMAAAATCFLRAKYHSLPDTRALYAYDYVSNVDRYSFLQYNQSGADQGRTALLQYLKLLQRIRRENIDYPSNLLHRNFALTYLRLYRMESSVGNASAAHSDMNLAQRELLAQGAKEQQVSAETLAKLIAARETKEAEIYNNTPNSTEARNPAPSERERK